MSFLYADLGKVLTVMSLYRNFSKLPSALCVRSICTMMQMAGQKA
jgi:hypothetical protein